MGGIQSEVGCNGFVGERDGVCVSVCETDDFSEELAESVCDLGVRDGG
jgi:hypothetical protein